jgi:carbon-monoxide dehydrogenase iron sulfur subunit
MAKMVYVDHTRCTGCRLCEIACSVNKNGSVNPARSRINVLKWEAVCVDTPVLCRQCESAPCVTVCPLGALVQEETMDRVTVDYDRCIGCRLCVTVCPFGAMGFDAVEKKVIKCDLCDGDPACVRFCETKALQYVDSATVKMAKMREAAENLSELIRRSAQGHME